MKLKPEEILLKTANFGKNYLKKHNHMPAGHNGPYIDKETPVRNTAHWAMIFFKSFELTQNEIFFDCGKKCIDYLQNHLKNNGYFICRDKKGKDSVNGLIGQAWAIEPLIEYTAFHEDEVLKQLVFDLINKHEFDASKGLWKKIPENNSEPTFDYTFNHQLWFASVCSGIKNPLIENYVIRFLDNIPNNLSLACNGRIGQSIHMGIYETNFKKFIKSIIRKRDSEEMRLKEIGYHAFNTYAFIRLNKNFPNHRFWKSKIFENILSYLNNDEYKTDIYKSTYGFKYNPPAFEVYATNLYFDKMCHVENDFLESIWDYQLKNSWNLKLEILSNGSFDSNTSIARAYECCECINV